MVLYSIRRILKFKYSGIERLFFFYQQKYLQNRIDNKVSLASWQMMPGVSRPDTLQNSFRFHTASPAAQVPG
jgi:hypothetical protein